MVPAGPPSPVWRFTPSRFALESRPLRELPPPFLCAIAWVLLRFGCPGSLRSSRFGPRLLRLRLVRLSRDRLFDGELCDRDLGLRRFSLDGDRLGFAGDGLVFVLRSPRLSR